jgi:predicted dienelactone hydrolase
MRTIFSLAVVAFASVALAATTQPISDPSSALGYTLSKTEDVSVIPIAQIPDSLRNKMIPLLIYAPKADHPSPVILFSHGAGGSGNAYAALLQFWASHGYVCIAPTHADSQTLQQPQMSEFRGVMNDQSITSSSWYDRVRDITTVMDHLNQIQEFYPALKDKMDLAHIGIAGHAYGAYTAQLIGGATVKARGATTQQSVHDRRIQAVLLLDGEGSGQQGLTKQSWNSWQVPLMDIVAAEGRGLTGQTPQWKLEPFSLSPAGDKYGAIINGATGSSFSGRLAGQKAGANPSPQARAFEDIKVLSLAFWDAYLKREPTAKTYLQSDLIEKSSNDEVNLQRR